MRDNWLNDYLALLISSLSLKKSDVVKIVYLGGVAVNQDIVHGWLRAENPIPLHNNEFSAFCKGLRRWVVNHSVSLH